MQGRQSGEIIAEEDEDEGPTLREEDEEEMEVEEVDRFTPSAPDEGRTFCFVTEEKEESFFAAGVGHANDKEDSAHGAEKPNRNSGHVGEEAVPTGNKVPMHTESEI